MAKVRVPVIGTTGKSVQINPAATKGATLTVDLLGPDGSVLSVDDLASLLGVLSVQDIQVAANVITDHGLLTGLGDNDHPQYARLAIDETVTGAYTFQNAAGVVVADAGGTDTIALSHDGADANLIGVNTANLNITGITSIQAGTVDADFDAITATSYGGIAEANLVSRAAAEEIPGLWNFAGVVDFGGVRINDGGLTDYILFDHTGVNARTQFQTTSAWDIDMAGLMAGVQFSDTGAAKFYIDKIGSLVEVRDGWAFRVRNASDLSYLAMAHSGTEATISTAGAIGGNIRLEPAGTAVDIRSGKILILRDASNADQLQLYHDGADANIVTNAGDLNLDPAGGFVDLLDGTQLRVRNTGNTTFFNFTVTGTAAEFSHSGLTNFDYLNFTSIRIRDGASLAIFGPGDANRVTISHDDTDVNVACTGTTDMNLTGVTTLQAGTVDADFDAITATSYGGITEANLVDKSAAETISAIWTFSEAGDPIIFSRGRVQMGTDRAAATFGLRANKFNFLELLVIGNSSGVEESVLVSQGGDTSLYSRNTQVFSVSESASAIKVHDGWGLRIQNSADTDYCQIQHDGVDLNFTHVNTTDWNITGITAIQAAAVNASFNIITAASYVQHVTYTDAQLNDITHAVNTDAGKILGAEVFNSTQGVPAYAQGAADGSVWADGAGTTINTPV